MPPQYVQVVIKGHHLYHLSWLSSVDVTGVGGHHCTFSLLTNCYTV